MPEHATRPKLEFMATNFTKLEIALKAAQATADETEQITRVHYRIGDTTIHRTVHPAGH